MHRRSTRSAASIALATWAIACLLAAAPARANDVTWINDGGGSFSDEANWTPDLPFSSDVPDSDDIAHFGLTTSSIGLPKTYTVSFDTDPTNQRLVVEDDRVTFDLNGHTYTATSPIAVVLATESGRQGRVAVMDGFFITPFQADIEIGSVAGSSGTLQVLTGGLVLGSPEIFVGVNGGGTLSIFNGGDVIADDTTLGLNSGVTGTATITGGGSSLLADNLVVGSSGIGTLNITADGRVDSTDGIVGDAVGSTGAVTVSGANSLWQMSDWLRVGFSGDGTLRIEDGGTVRDEVALVKGSAVVTGGSAWINEGALNVGTTSASPGNLTIESGSQVQNGNSNLAISNGGKAFALVRDSGTAWTCTDALNVGFVGEGELTIESGAAVTSVGGGVAVSGGSKGTARITGSTSTWSTSGDFSVGGGGDGQLDISSGQLLFTNENDLIVGDAGSGRMTISSGGQALDAFETVIGNLAGSTGELTVTGSGSQLRTLDRLTVGDGGRGTLLIADKGRVSNDVGIIRGVDSSVRVQGTNSAWTNGSVLNLFGNAALVIEDGGAVVSVGSDINGSVAVAGADSFWSVGGELTVGGVDDGSLTITGGGVFSGTSFVGRNSGSISTVTVAGTGSIWSVGGDLNIGGSGLSNNGGVGTVRIQSGATVDVTSITNLHQGDAVILEGGHFSSFRVIFNSGHGTFQWTGGTLNVSIYERTLEVPVGGVLDVGHGFGLNANKTFVEGGYNQSAGGVLEIEAFASGVGTIVEQLVVTDTAVVGGSLIVKLNAGVIIDPATNYTIFDALSIAGSFANVANGQRLITSDGLGSFVVNYGAGSPFDPSQIVLSAFLPSLPGDYNQNGTVDAADYTVWRDHLGQTFTLTGENPAAATPGVVDAEDYAFWKAHFGEAAGSGAGAIGNSAVPEPETLVLLILTIFGVSLGRRRTAAKVAELIPA